MNILALDLATKTGWAIARNGQLVESGVQVFDIRRGESPGLRFLRFRSWLEDLLTEAAPDLVAYEQAHHRGGAATELCVGFATRVQELAAGDGIEYASVHTSTLKKHATGHGNAQKDAMVAAARKRWGIEPEDDNHADALLILAWALDTYGAVTRGRDSSRLSAEMG